MEYNSDPYEDKWSNKPINELMRQRPLGVTILATLQIIGAIITLVLVFLLPSLFRDYDINELFGIPFLELFILFAFITTLVSILLAAGLLNGEKWARKVTIVFQIINVVTSLINLNIIGIAIPIIIISYLNKPDIREFFTREPKFNKTIRNLIIGAVILIIIFNLSTTIYLRAITGL